MQALDDYAQQAALVHALKAEFLAEVPIENGDEVLNNSFVSLFEHGDMHLEMALQTALAERSPNHKATDIAPLHDLAQKHASKVTQRIGGVLAAGELDQKTWQLFKDGAQVDLNAWALWCTATNDRATETHMKRLRWRRDRHQKCKQEAQNFLDGMGANPRIFLPIWNKQAKMTIEHLKEKLVARHFAASAQSVCWLPLLNWSSLSLVSSPVMKFQSDLLGSLVNQPQSAGPVISGVILPVIGMSGAAGTGQLWRPTNKAYEALFSAGINSDRFFMLQYDKLIDERSYR